MQRGWRCLEFGAGGGSIAAWLCDRVAPDGAVVATDLDTTVLEEVAHPDLDEDDLPEGEAKRGAGSGRCRSRSCATGSSRRVSWGATTRWSSPPGC